MTDSIARAASAASPARSAAHEIPDSTVTALFEARVDRQPDETAVRHLSAAMTYAELDRAAETLSARLRSRGVGRGDVVGVFVQRSIPMVIGILAVLKTGAAYAPQDARISPRMLLGRVAASSRMRVALTTEDFLNAMPDAVDAMVIDTALIDDTQLDDAGAVMTRASVDRRASDVCAVIYTSGTTGSPNGVQVTDGNLVNLFRNTPGDLGIGRGTTVGQVLNIAFDMAMWEILGTLVNGGTLVIRGSDIAETAEQVDVLIATPSIVSTLSSARCHARTVVVAGERCPQALADEWAAEHRFLNSCGPTEITIINTLVEHVPGRALSIGTPVPGTTVYVLDDEQQPVPAGEIGEMWVGGAGVTLGYIGDPELTAQRYLPDPFSADGGRMFRTRDVGRWTSRGELEHLSRTDDQVKVRGFRVELDSVSRALETSLSCTTAVTVQLDARRLGAVITPASADPEAARAAVAALLPYYCVPSDIITVDRIPLTARGKADRAAVLRMIDTGARPRRVA
ncbi:Gramicidin S synthase 1 [Microbacterium oxydans]|uniref:Gramicidin S synthase 1 n=1 Tax=Microbacterium oxydans TaxID=82380 RepID=A0A0F0KZD6_9MICO|nr:amino acid adenylation domain-containing protein [Microbacterium oxydans]KJL25480.1 Gramicidin S synthase 1 [Microbacterium oxydans]